MPLYYFLFCGPLSYSLRPPFIVVPPSTPIPSLSRYISDLIPSLARHSCSRFPQRRDTRELSQTVIILNSVNLAPAPRQPSHSYFLNVTSCTVLYHYYHHRRGTTRWCKLLRAAIAAVNHQPDKLTRSSQSISLISLRWFDCLARWDLLKKDFSSWITPSCRETCRWEQDAIR